MEQESVEIEYTIMAKDVRTKILISGKSLSLNLVANENAAIPNSFFLGFKISFLIKGDYQCTLIGMELYYSSKP